MAQRGELKPRGPALGSARVHFVAQIQYYLQKLFEVLARFDRLAGLVVRVDLLLAALDFALALVLKNHHAQSYSLAGDLADLVLKLARLVQHVQRPFVLAK